MVRYTGLGSLPGTDFPAALRMTFDKAPEFAYLPELPARGPWAAMIGRTTAVLAGMTTEFEAGRWRLSDAPGIDQRRARATLRDDLERLEEYGAEYAGHFKVAFAGPWTMAAALEHARSGRVLADEGARRDLAGALAEGIGELLADLKRRMPELDLVLQLDEPALPRVLTGGIPTAGGFFRHRAVEPPEVVGALRGVTGESARRGLNVDAVVHCCAPGLPIRLMAAQGHYGAGFTGLSVDGELIDRTQWDEVAAAVEAGAQLYLGAFPTEPGSGPATADSLTRRVLNWVRPLELGPVLAQRLVLTPACGLAGFTASQSSAVFDALAAAARNVAEDLSE